MEPSMLPCGTPAVTVHEGERHPSMTTYCLRSLRLLRRKSSSIRHRRGFTLHETRYVRVVCSTLECHFCHCLVPTLIRTIFPGGGCKRSLIENEVYGA